MSDAPQLVGRTALVTGASRGIGRRMFESLAAEGAPGWSLARSAGALAELARGPGVGRVTGQWPNLESRRKYPGA